MLCGCIQQLFRCQAQPLNGCVDPWPVLREKLLAFAFEQQIARASFDEHAETALRFDELLADQFLVGLENRERIDPILVRDISHGRQRVAFVEHALENHSDDTIPKLSINRLPIVPFTLHPVFHYPPSCSDIVNYNTTPPASSFFEIFSYLPRR